MILDVLYLVKCSLMSGGKLSLHLKKATASQTCGHIIVMMSCTMEQQKKVASSDEALFVSNVRQTVWLRKYWQVDAQCSVQFNYIFIAPSLNEPSPPGALYQGPYSNWNCSVFSWQALVLEFMQMLLWLHIPRHSTGWPPSAGCCSRYSFQKGLRNMTFKSWIDTSVGCAGSLILQASSSSDAPQMLFRYLLLQYFEEIYVHHLAGRTAPVRGLDCY